MLAKKVLVISLYCNLNISKIRLVGKSPFLFVKYLIVDKLFQYGLRTVFIHYYCPLPHSNTTSHFPLNQKL